MLLLLENYTVRVPVLVEVPENYTVQVPQLQDETFTYTVSVAQVVAEQRMQTVTNAVPVTKTRTIQVCVPSTTMQSVSKDYGHWEEQVVSVGSALAATAGNGCGSSCGGCAPACDGCGSVVATSCGEGCSGVPSIAGVSYASAGGCGS